MSRGDGQVRALSEVEAKKEKGGNRGRRWPERQCRDELVGPLLPL